MARIDWDRDGKNDIVDDYIEYELINNNLEDTNTDGGGHHPSGSGSTSDAVLCTIAGLIEDALFFALLGVDADNIPVSAKMTPGMEKVGHANAAMIDHNMAIAATELGVGCVYIYGAIAAINGTPELLAKLHLPEGFVPSAGLAVGVTDYTYTEREIPTDRISQNAI